jgi:hypothetical protein
MLTRNIGYPKLREHLGAVVATMRPSKSWHDFKAKLDRNCKRYSVPIQTASILKMMKAKEFAESGRQPRLASPDTKQSTTPRKRNMVACAAFWTTLPGP